MLAHTLNLKTNFRKLSKGISRQENERSSHAFLWIKAYIIGTFTTPNGIFSLLVKQYKLRTESLYIPPQNPYFVFYENRKVEYFEVRTTE